jgi:hypothetical protein
MITMVELFHARWPTIAQSIFKFTLDEFAGDATDDVITALSRVLVYTIANSTDTSRVDATSLCIKYLSKCHAHLKRQGATEH